MKKYIKPEFEVIEFEEEVLTIESGGSLFEDNDDSPTVPPIEPPIIPDEGGFVD